MIISAADLKNIRKRLTGKRVVFADGTFDLFHLGHVASFKNLRNFGDVLIISVMSDEWVKSKKGGNRPVLSEIERLELVDSIRYVDYTILAKNGETNQRIPTSQLLRKLIPDVFVSIDPAWEKRRGEFKEIGIELHIIPRTHESSTTKLLERIRRAWN